MSATDLKSYRPGSWFGVFGAHATVLLPPSEKSRVAALWELVDGGADFDEVLDALIASGLRDLPGFVLVNDDRRHHQGGAPGPGPGCLHHRRRRDHRGRRNGRLHLGRADPDRRAVDASLARGARRVDDRRVGRGRRLHDHRRAGAGGSGRQAAVRRRTRRQLRRQGCRLAACRAACDGACRGAGERGRPRSDEPATDELATESSRQMSSSRPNRRQNRWPNRWQRSHRPRRPCRPRRPAGPHGVSQPASRPVRQRRNPPGVSRRQSSPEHRLRHR